MRLCNVQMIAAVSAAALLALGGIKVPAQAQGMCQPVLSGFEMCDLDTLPNVQDFELDAESDTLVIMMGDYWLDMNRVPDDFADLSDTDLLDLMVEIGGDEAEGPQLSMLSQAQFDTADTRAITRILQEQDGDETDSFSMTVAGHAEGRILVMIDGGATGDVDALEDVTQRVLATLRPRVTD